MCGIAGILATNPSARISPRALRRMIAVLRHRGPDGHGMYLDDHVGLAHARLSIVDLSGGAQPIHNEDRTIWVTFNGEIFNYVELRAELESHGHRFYTRSDTEVIVHAYEQWGSDAWRRFNGQFAVGLWDSRKRELWLARDRVGIVPLFYSVTSGHIVFGSEVKALLASGAVQPRLDPAGLARVFSLWSAPAPWSVFAGIRTLQPGSALCIRADGQLRHTVYWQPTTFTAGATRPSTLRDAAAELQDRLTHAIKIRLRADVPVGAYLSGGLDSSVIARLTRLVDSSPLQTFSLRFADPAFDETAAQRTMASILGTTHHEIVVGARDISEAIPDVIWHCETPLLRTGPAPMFLLSGLVRKSGMKVVLTGEGADEFLAGYDVFKESRIRRFWARQPESESRAALLSRVHPYVAGAQKTGAMWKEFFRTGLAETDSPFYSHRLRWDATAWGLRFLSAEVREAGAMPALESDVPALLPSDWRSWPKLCQAQAIEIATFMSSYLLTSQGDRVAMGHSVESRYPFLDPDVIDFAANLPPRYKMSGLRDKLVLRTLASQSPANLPAEVWQRRKWPYRAPIAGALFGADAPNYVRELLSPAALAESGLIDSTAASGLAARFIGKPARMGEREEMALVGLLTLQLLNRSMIRGLGARVTEAEQRLSDTQPLILEDHRTPAHRGLAEAGHE